MIARAPGRSLATARALRLMLLLAEAIAVLPASAAVTIAGMVVRDHAQGAPAPGVPIAVPGAQPVSSDAQGRFTLVVDRIDAGSDKATVSVPGWGIVNAELIELPAAKADAVANATAVPLRVIVCQPVELERRREEFFRGIARDAVRQSLARQRRQASSPTEHTRLIAASGHAEKLATEWAESIAPPSPDAAGGLHRPALRLFARGQSDEALKLLDDKALEQEARSGRANIDLNVRAWQLRALLLATHFDLDAAEATHRQATRLAPDSFEAWFGLATFGQRLLRGDAAEAGSEKALSIARAGADPRKIALAAAQLARWRNAQDRNAEARVLFLEALAIRRELARTQSILHLHAVARTLDDLGDLSKEEDQPADARARYQESVQLARQLAKAHPALHRPTLAGYLHNLAAFDGEQGRMSDALAGYAEALRLYRELAKDLPARWRVNIAGTAYGMAGGAAEDPRRQAEARALYDEAIGVLRGLVAADREEHLWLLGSVLGNSGRLHKGHGRYAEARLQHEEAVQIYRELGTNNLLGGWQLMTGTSLFDLSLVSVAQGRPDEARGQLSESLDIHRELAKKLPEIVRHAIAKSAVALAEIDLTAGRVKQAHALFGEALQHYRKLIETDRATYIAGTASALRRLGAVNRVAGRLLEARSQLEEVLQIDRELAKGHPSAYRSGLASTLYQMGMLCRSEGRHAESMSWHEQSLAMRRELLKTDADELLLVGESMYALAIAYAENNRRAEAGELMKETLATYRELARRSPGRHADDLRDIEGDLRLLQRR